MKLLSSILILSLFCVCPVLQHASATSAKLTTNQDCLLLELNELFPAQPKKPSKWLALNQRISNAIQHPSEALEQKYLKSSTIKITSIGQHLGSGAWASVYEVKTAKETLALKLFSKNQVASESLIPALSMHEVLGELGFAPKLRGVLKPEDVSQIIGMLPERVRPRYDETSVGVLMEKINDCANMNYNSRFPYKINDIKTQSSILRRIDAIEKALESLQIYPGDLQFLTTREGSIFLSDLDQYLWIDKNNKLHGAVSDGSRLVPTHDIKLNTSFEPKKQRSKMFELLKKNLSNGF